MEESGIVPAPSYYKPPVNWPGNDGFNADADYSGDTYEKIDPRDRILFNDKDRTNWIQVGFPDEDTITVENESPKVMGDILDKQYESQGTYNTVNGYIGSYAIKYRIEHPSNKFLFAYARQLLGLTLFSRKVWR